MLHVYQLPLSARCGPTAQGGNTALVDLLLFVFGFDPLISKVLVLSGHPTASVET